jgi:hypothetical protein
MLSALLQTKEQKGAYRKIPGKRLHPAVPRESYFQTDITGHPFRQISPAILPDQ